ncbi:MAG TPA: toll/interleukin-1 receptor domain-containing protein [Polyangiaceae bacterium]|nr:toll/interleukin-1 receptor domain-containing protein [Polyangiaceae bacterium]
MNLLRGSESRFPFETSEIEVVRPKVPALRKRRWRLPKKRKVQIIDDDVQFTLYRPEAVAAARWETLLVFTHRSKADVNALDLDPPEEVERRAEQILGDALASYTTARIDAGASIPRESEITLVPQAKRARFNSERITFEWLEPVHSAEFRLCADERAAGSVVHGRVSAFIGPILVAEVPFSVPVSRAVPPSRPRRAASARLFKSVFPSYAHADQAIVEACGRSIKALGIDFLIDVWSIRSGEKWTERLAELIDRADAFQLFWSTNAMRSPHVRAEWEYALRRRGTDFIRPVFWEDPFPEDREEDLPPAALRELHFAKLSVDEPNPAILPAAPRRRSRGRAAKIVSSLAVVLIGAGLWRVSQPVGPGPVSDGHPVSTSTGESVVVTTAPSAPPKTTVTLPPPAVAKHCCTQAGVGKTCSQATCSACALLDCEGATGSAHPAPKPPASAARVTNCNPNFYLDGSGQKHFKPECF